MDNTRKRPSEQIYSDYTQEDFEVWKLLYDRQMEFLKGKVADEFIEAIDQVGFTSAEIPHFERVNQRLAEATGWKIKTVPNIAEADVFFENLANKTFTATCWLRSMDEIDYLEEPDMFHDVFAHTPLLSNESYTEFFQAMGAIALDVIDDPEKVKMLQRLYWFTIEFGLIQSGEDLKIYGAGIVSSKGESEHALSDDSEKRAYNVEQIMAHDFRTDIIQDTYYVIESFDELTSSLPRIKELVA
ncbi:MAG: phenylalanine 4-monooxygenase [Balneolaceae bacterium]|nr:phenylalanine 4-monooxygenase [Balneolaceae bacterium]